MKMMKIIVVLCTILASGCINCYVRCPGTNAKITHTYQSTEAAFGLSYVVMFPQIMNPENNIGFYPENLITVPIGCICFIDVACEAIIDTLLWPIDKTISNSELVTP